MGVHVVPETDASDQLNIGTLDSVSTKAVKDFLDGQVNTEGFSSTTSLLKSTAEPVMDGSDTYRTFYNQSTICELGAIPDAGSSDIILGCAPMSTYVPAAKALKPLFEAFVAANQRYADPQKNGLWLEFSSNNSAFYNSYIADSATSGYQTGTLTVEVVKPADLNYTDNLDGDPEFFWTKNNNWHALPNAPSALPDGTNLSTLPCSYTFPSSDAKEAFIGQPCQEQNQQDSMSTFQ